jgi:DNA-binding NtrC family response regulator
MTKARSTTSRLRGCVLVIEDDPALRAILSSLLSGWGFSRREAADGEQALAIMAAEPITLVMTDWVMPRLGGMDLVVTLRSRFPKTPIIVLTGQGSIQAAVDATRRGVCDFLTKPVDNKTLHQAIEAALAGRQQPEPAGSLHDQDLIGLDGSLSEVRRMLEVFGFSSVNILIEGETGTGKEAVMHAFRRHGPRAEDPLVTVDCTSVPATLFESELFGHLKGAYTDAASSRSGLVRKAHAGTLFLDEVTEIPVDVQAKLLRVIETGKVRPVGSDAWEAVDVRMIAASSRDVRAEVTAGRFRPDLYYRLAVVHIRLPPLRERKQDIPTLVEHLSGRRTGLGPVSVAPEVIGRLAQHDWPGNVRELRNVIEYAAVACRGGTIRLEHLPPGFAASVQPPAARPESLRELERLKIREALTVAGGNRATAARLLGISRATLYRRLRED